MLVRAYPEIFINNTNDIHIKDTTNAILNPDILEKYQDELINNKSGCIFKIINNNSQNCICVEDYVACREFTAPPGIIYLPDDIYDNLLLSPDEDIDVKIELFMPPQATKIKLRIGSEDLFNINLKEALENVITKNYKFLKIDDIITIGNSYVTVTELEPYHICMVNDTELNVDFEYPNQSLMDTRCNNLKHENMLDTTVYKGNSERVNIDINCKSDSDIEEEVKPLSRTELRNKRLAFFNK
jgi:hypothetical protein|tara:strand:+ start:146 stop:871 length:726 start_codon:yes stop_codon:yes gene_type:complete